MFLVGQVQPQHTVLQRMPVLDNLHYLGHNFWSAGPIAVKLDCLETRHPNISSKPKIIEFGSVFREICLLEVGLTADVNAFITKRVKHVFSFLFRLCCLMPLPKPCIPLSIKAKKCENEGCMNPLCYYTLFTTKDIKRHTSSPLVHPNVAVANLLVFFTPFNVFYSTFLCVRLLLYMGYSWESF